jgi:hypothetical protein
MLNRCGNNDMQNHLQNRFTTNLEHLHSLLVHKDHTPWISENAVCRLSTYFDTILYVSTEILLQSL